MQADFHDDPRDFFAFMNSHGIGDELSLFYRSPTTIDTPSSLCGGAVSAWAVVLETRGSYDEAAQVYHSGLLR